MAGKLVITRKHNQCVWIGDTCVKVEIPPFKGRQIRLVISAESNVLILRDELKNKLDNPKGESDEQR
jgi:carbon storage regulator CsrA